VSLDDLTFDDSHDPELVGLLSRRIYEFNVGVTGLDDGRELSLRASSTTGELLGGLTGWTWGGCGYVDVLWVATGSRGRGIGSRLLELAEREAVARGAVVMALSTHSFQAPAFYRERGYVDVGRTEGYPAGYAQVHLRKDLAD
jgi:ribosomal protein S18 acetylase RimI-like enzyme